MKTFDKLFPETAKKREEQSQQLKDQEKEDTQLFNSIFSSDNGVKALRRLMQKCRYQHDNSLFTSTGEERVEVLRRFEAQRAIYLWIRKFINKETLKRVEIGD